MATKSRKIIPKKDLLRTFTYYIPAPPQRKTGYREKEFDKIMTGILSSGFELLEFQTQVVGGEQGGLFIIAVIRARTARVAQLDEAFDLQDRFKLAHSHSSPDIILEDDDA